MSIFDEQNKVKNEIVDWTEVGQTIEGTYVGKKEGVTTRYGKNVLYEFKEKSGNILKIWGRKIIDDQMKHIKLGQIVGMKFIASHPKPGRSDFKEIQIYANPNVVDEEWLKSQEEMAFDQIKDEFGGTEVNELAPAGGPTRQVATGDGEPDKLKAIHELAKTKLGVTDPMEVKDKVQESTKLAFLEMNFDDIIKGLESLPDKV